MKLLDYNTVTDKDIFLLNLHGENVEFSMVENDDMPAFFQTCMKLNLLDFMCQKEYRGTLATFKIVRPFMFRMNLEKGAGYRESTIILLPDDLLNITEILMAHDYYREPDPGTNGFRYLHELHFDFSREQRNKSYKSFNYEM